MEINGKKVSRADREGFYVRAEGAELFVQQFPATGTARGKVLCLPGMGNYGWYFAPLAQRLTPQGVAVYATDYRGTGLSLGARWDIPSEAVWTRDVASILAALPGADLPTFLLGHSLGAALALHAAVRLQHVLSGLIVVAPAMTVASDPLPWANYLMFPIGMLFRGRPLLRPPYPDYTAMLAKHADEELARALQCDPYRLHLMSSRCGLALNRVRNLEAGVDAAKGTDLPTAVVCGTDDSALRGAIAYFESLRSEDKTLVTLPGAHHHLLRGGEKEDAQHEISAWLEEHLVSRLPPD